MQLGGGRVGVGERSSGIQLDHFIFLKLLKKFKEYNYVNAYVQKQHFQLFKGYLHAVCICVHYSQNVFIPVSPEKVKCPVFYVLAQITFISDLY